MRGVADLDLVWVEFRVRVIVDSRERVMCTDAVLVTRSVSVASRDSVKSSVIVYGSDSVSVTVSVAVVVTLGDGDELGVRVFDGVPENDEFGVADMVADALAVTESDRVALSDALNVVERPCVMVEDTVLERACETVSVRVLLSCGVGDMVCVSLHRFDFGGALFDATCIEIPVGVIGRARPLQAMT